MKLWVARDKDGRLYLYDSKPIREKDYFDVKAFALNVELNPTYFPEVTFENSPREVEIKLI